MPLGSTAQRGPGNGTAVGASKVWFDMGVRIWVFGTRPSPQEQILSLVMTGDTLPTSFLTHPRGQSQFTAATEGRVRLKMPSTL